MRAVIGVVTLGLLVGGLTTQARAIGCISGGLAGAVAGHMVHHGVLGAIGGCVAGHTYNKHQKAQRMQNSGYGNDGYPSGGARGNDGNDSYGGYPSGGARSNY